MELFVGVGFFLLLRLQTFFLPFSSSFFRLVLSFSALIADGFTSFFFFDCDPPAEDALSESFACPNMSICCSFFSFFRLLLSDSDSFPIKLPHPVRDGLPSRELEVLLIFCSLSCRLKGSAEGFFSFCWFSDFFFVVIFGTLDWQDLHCQIERGSD